MIEGWYRARALTAPPEPILPKLGIVVFEESRREDLAAMWLYMDNSVGVCFPEHIVTRPGLSLGLARESLLRGLDFLRLSAVEMGYGVMIVHTLPAMARVLERRGVFARQGKQKVSMIGSTKGG